MTDRNALIAEHVPHFRGWLSTVAWSLLSPEVEVEHDDLCQEGLIAMWRAVDTHDPERGGLGGWMQYKARLRMIDVRNHAAPLTGQERGDRTRGDSRGEATRARIRAHLREHPRDGNGAIARALGIAASTVTFHRARLNIDTPPPQKRSLELLIEREADGWGDELGDAILASDDLVAHVIEQYHHGRIVEALDLLTPAERKYVVLRFWHGYGSTQMREAFGYDPNGLWRSARKRLRPALVDLVAA